LLVVSRDLESVAYAVPNEVPAVEVGQSGERGGGGVGGEVGGAEDGAVVGEADQAGVEGGVAQGGEEQAIVDVEAKGVGFASAQGMM